MEWGVNDGKAVVELPINAVIVSSESAPEHQWRC